MSQNTNCHSSIHLSLDFDLINQVPSDNILSARCPSTSSASSSLGFHLSGRSSAARALVTEVKLAMEQPLVQWPPPRNENHAFFAHFSLRGPLGPRLGSLEPGMAPRRPFYNRLVEPSKYENCFFSLNFDIKMFHYLKVRIENVPLRSDRGEILPLSPPPPAAPLFVRHSPYNPALLHPVATISSTPRRM